MTRRRVEEAWIDFARIAMPTVSDFLAVAVLREAFFAGAIAVHTILASEVPGRSREEGLAVIRGIEEEFVELVATMEVADGSGLVD